MKLANKSSSCVIKFYSRLVSSLSISFIKSQLFKTDQQDRLFIIQSQSNSVKKTPPAFANRRCWSINLLSLGFLFTLVRWLKPSPAADRERQRIAFAQGAVFHSAVSRLLTPFCQLRLNTDHFLKFLNPDILEFQFRAVAQKSDITFVA
jgi:hypothetical protein